jgi:hypothetical protein
LSVHRTEAQAAEDAKKKAVEDKKKAEIAAKTMTLEDKIKKKMAAFMAKKSANEDIIGEIAEDIDYMTIHIPKINVVTVDKTETLYDNNRRAVM